MKKCYDRRKAGRGTRLLFRILALFCLLLSFSAGHAENLLKNGSFEEVDGRGMPVDWGWDAYFPDEGYTVFSVSGEDAAEGKQSAYIRNLDENDARFSQKVSVKPESLYRFSGYIRTEDVDSGLGANLSLEGLYAFSDSVYETSDGWKYIEWYGETGPDQTTVTLFARLGGYSGESTGKAWFDDLKLEEVDEVPGDETATLWYHQKTISYYDEDEDDEADTGSASPAWPRLMMLVLLWAAIAVLLIQWLYRLSCRKDRLQPVSSGLPFFIPGLMIAFLLRLIIAYFVLGYMVDVNCFTSWGATMLNYGPAGFYPETQFCDYPPAYTYILGLNTLICRMIPDISAGMTRVVHRFVPALCDILSCIVLDLFLKKREKKLSPFVRRAGILLLAFHPVSILNSAAWGQMDSAFVFLLLLVAVWALEGRWELCLPCYTLSVLVKPQALMLGFLGLTAIVLSWIREKKSRRRILNGVAFSLLIMLAVIIPFSLRQHPLWIINQYAGPLASYPYATVNTANFYYLFGGNWNSISNGAPVAVPLILGTLAAAFGIGFVFLGRTRWKHRWIETSLSALFVLWFSFCAFRQASWSLAGTGAMAFSFLIVLSLYIRNRKIEFLPYLGGLLFLLLYVFGVKMHERYVFPVFLFFSMAYGLRRDRRILTVLLTITCTSFLNESIVLDNSIRLGSALGHLNQDTHILAMILSSVNVLTGIYAVWVGLSTDYSGEVSLIPVQVLKEPKNSNRLEWRRLDTILIAVILTAYSLICFPTLGSMKAPQTAWTSTEYTENVVLDLGESRDSFVMLYFARVSRNDFSVAVSEDGKNWDDETWAQMDQGQCWKWKYVTDSAAAADGKRSYGNNRHWFSGRYVRITAHQINLALCEVIFRDGNGEIIPIHSCTRFEGDQESSLYSDPSFLMDEQDSFEGLPVYFHSEADEYEGEEDPRVPQPSWWNSTYFDEIYHARTAWEFLNCSAPYETSHPPLGKILMSWGVAIFGMTPFGWRFAGAMAGVLMLVMVYLIARQMTKRTLPSAFACGLMALDCMHMTQTQIATIDSFPVLFILLAYFFMLRFLQTDWRTEKKRRVLTDLGLSGFGMGLAIASKWIGIYAGAGLALLFFWHCFRVLRSEPAIVESPKNRGRTPDHGKSGSFTRFLILCVWCILFFAVIPVCIYLLSYLPYFAYRHLSSPEEYLQAVWTSQLNMLNYHSTPGLGMDHPFYSPWYEWPIIGKPMFYSTKQYLFQNSLSFSIFCFGNPAVWWVGIPAMLLAVWRWIRNRDEKLPLPVAAGNRFASLDTNHVFLLIGFLAQYLPWTLVPRGTYIYHYFASVPFLILAIDQAADQLGRHSRSGERIEVSVLLTIAALCFGMLFPYVSGILAPVPWLEIGKKMLNIWY